MNLHLQNKNALVCGSTQGIGKATAILLAKEGANVTLIARNEEKLKAVLEELNTYQLEQSIEQCHSYLVADFSKPEELKKVIENSNLRFHILVNNTGGPRSGAILDATLDEFQQAFSQHLLCNHILVQAVVPFMKTQCFGRIINVMTATMKNYSPAKRFAKPEETASAIVFLASEKASYINGINLPVDGGRTKSL